MGSVLKSAVHAITLGTVNLNKEKKASGAQATALEEEKKDSIRKRKALYGTKGGVLGQEVQGIGQDERGSIFGN